MVIVNYKLSGDKDSDFGVKIARQTDNILAKSENINYLAMLIIKSVEL